MGVAWVVMGLWLGFIRDPGGRLTRFEKDLGVSGWMETRGIILLEEWHSLILSRN